MHLVAGIPGSPRAQLGEVRGLGHLTPMGMGWLLGIVFEVDGIRLIANHVVSSDESASSVGELAARLQAIGARLGSAPASGPSTARHVLDAGTALEAVLARVGQAGTTELSARQLDIACRLLGERLANPLYVSEVAAACDLSEGHFRRAFRFHTGVSPQQWRQERRIRYCRERLAETDEPLSTIARCAGFSAQSHFSRVFTQLTGLSPSEWRRLVRPATRAGNLNTSTLVYAQEVVEACV